MTITVTDIDQGPYAATGAAQTVPYTFMTLTDGEIDVFYDAGFSRVLVDPAFYTVAPNKTVDGAAKEGGSVELAIGAAPAGSDVYLRAAPRDDRDVVWSDVGSRLRNLNDEQDRMTLGLLVANEKMSRALVVNPGSPVPSGQDIVDAAIAVALKANKDGSDMTPEQSGDFRAAIGALKVDGEGAVLGLLDNVPFSASGIGSAVRSASGKIEESVSIDDFFLIGHADDRASFYAATAAVGERGGGTVFLTKTEYRVAGELPIAFNNVTIAGRNIGGTKIVQTLQNSKTFNITGTWATITDVTVEYEGTPVAGATAFHIKAQNTHLDRFVVRNAYIGIQLGEGLASDCGGARISNFQLLECIYSSIFANGTLDVFVNNFVINAVTETNGLGGNVRMRNQNEAFVLSNGDVLIGKYSLDIDSASGLLAERTAYCRFTNIFFDSGAEGSRISRCYLSDFSGAWFSGGRTGSGFPGVEIIESTGLTFSGGQAFNCGGHGIYVRSSCNRLSFLGVMAFANCVTAASGSCNGVQIEGGATDISIVALTGAAFFGGFVRQGYALGIGAGCQRVYAAPVMGAGNTLGAVNNLSSGETSVKIEAFG